MQAILDELGRVAQLFQLASHPLSSARLGDGHINESHVLACEDGSRFVFQRINTRVFRDVAELMSNVSRVCNHLSAQGARCLTLVPTVDGKSFASDETGYWRVYPLIEGTFSHRHVDSPEEAARAGCAFGRFQFQLKDLPAPRLFETIPQFHDTSLRLKVLERAASSDHHSRAHNCSAELEFLFSRRAYAKRIQHLLDSGAVPERIVHNDAKISNVLLDSVTHEVVCVVDFDTVMPGSALYDFGDMCRTMTTGVDEDEPDLSKVELNEELFASLVAGYMSEAGRILTSDERANLATAGIVITYEQAVRFLTDYLMGDTYYRVHDCEHNLRRARTQIKLASRLEANETRLASIVGRA